MTGQEFKIGILIDNRNVEEIGRLVGCSRDTLYRYFKMKEVPEKYVRRAKAFDVWFPTEEIAELKARIKELENRRRGK